MFFAPFVGGDGAYAKKGTIERSIHALLRGGARFGFAPGAACAAMRAKLNARESSRMQPRGTNLRV